MHDLVLGKVGHGEHAAAENRPDLPVGKLFALISSAVNLVLQSVVLPLEYLHSLVLLGAQVAGGKDELLE